MIHFQHGGLTVIENLVTLCIYHHKLLHEGGWRLSGELNGPVKFVKPDGTQYIEHKPPPLHTELAETLTQAITAQAARYNNQPANQPANHIP